MNSLILFAHTNTKTFYARDAITVSGKIIDQDGLPLIGVNILIKGTSKGVVTDFDGNYSIDGVEEDAVLVISYIGYQTQEINVNGRTTIDITMSSDAQSLEEVIVVGYGEQKKATVTGAVAAIGGDDLSKSPTVNMSNSLGGRLAGVTAIQSSGEPGYDNSTIRIRGSNTLGNSEALVVIDGIPDRAGGLARLNPADIESVSVLKDASAAIYGARAANGVILITTKKGKTGKPSLSYSFNQGITQPTVIPRMSNAVQYAEIINELTIFDGLPADQWTGAWSAFNSSGTYTRTDNGNELVAPFQPDDFTKYRTQSDPWTHPDEDYFASVLKPWSPQSQHTLSLNGGTDVFQYYASLGYQNQDGIYHNSATGYKQYNLQINLDAQINDYVSLGIGLTGREEFRFFPTQSADAIFRMMMRGKPTDHVVWPNGLPAPDIENGQNPYVITTNQTGYDRDKQDYIQGTGRLEIKIPGVEGLKLRGTAALDKFSQSRKVWQTPWELYYWDGVTMENGEPKLVPNIRSTFVDPRLTLYDANNLNILLSAFLEYQTTIGDHEIGALVATSKETYQGDNFNAFRRYFISSTVDQIFAGGDPEKNNGGDAYERARLSYFGRMNYNYQHKYLAEFLWRYDGSYLFPENSRYGFFPGLLVGWTISEENFWKDNIPNVNFLKLRASWGQMGNDQVYYNDVLQEYKYLATYAFGTYVIDDQLVKSLRESVVPNPDFTWEVANNRNIGLDGEIFNSKINFTLEYFNNKRTDILWQASGSTPQTAGISSLLPPQNIGEVQNQGWEFSVGYHKRQGKFTYSISANGGYARNKVLFADEAEGTPAWQRFTGNSFGTNGFNYLAYLYDGVFEDFDDIADNELDYSAVTNNLQPGDMKFKDIGGTDANGNFVMVPDGKINSFDRIRLDKNRDPWFTGGLNIQLGYGAFDATILFQGAAGGLLYIGTESGDIGNFLHYDFENRWTIDEPSSVYPRLTNRRNKYYSGGAFSQNTYWLRSNDYIRLKNFEVGYTLPQELSEKVRINGLRVYINGNNLLTWDELGIWDPEATSTNGRYYPQSRIINAGLSVRF